MTVSNPIYLDHAATAPLDPDVLTAMLPFLSGPLSSGNASSVHGYGRPARAAIDTARDQVASLIHADYSEIYFTGSGTEADNLALTGYMLAAPSDRDHLVVSSIEHHAVLNTAHFLRTLNKQITLVPADSKGRIAPEAVADAMTDRTALVSVMHANNEIGVVQPIAEIAAIAHARGARFHTDAVQSAGLLPVDFAALGCDMLTLSAHKLYGPKGVGALAVRSGLKVSPLIYGGSQEREKRAGTENVAGIVGFGKAAQIGLERRETDAPAMSALRDAFILRLEERIAGIHLNGCRRERLPNNVNISVEGVEGPTLLMNLDRRGVYASSGAACSSGSIEPSHVLKAIGLPDRLAASGIRFTLGRATTGDELAATVDILAEIVERLRKR